MTAVIPWGNRGCPHRGDCDCTHRGDRGCLHQNFPKGTTGVLDLFLKLIHKFSKILLLLNLSRKCVLKNSKLDQI